MQNRVQKAMKGRLFSFTTAPQRLNKVLEKWYLLRVEEIMYFLCEVDAKTLCFKKEFMSSFLAGKNAKPYLALLLPVLYKYSEVLDYIAKYGNLTDFFVEQMNGESSEYMQILTLELKDKNFFYAILKAKHLLHPKVLNILKNTPRYADIYMQATNM